VDHEQRPTGSRAAAGVDHAALVVVDNGPIPPTDLEGLGRLPGAKIGINGTPWPNECLWPDDGECDETNGFCDTSSDPDCRPVEVEAHFGPPAPSPGLPGLVEDWLPTDPFHAELPVALQEGCGGLEVRTAAARTCSTRRAARSVPPPPRVSALPLPPLWRARRRGWRARGRVRSGAQLRVRNRRHQLHRAALAFAAGCRLSEPRAEACASALHLLASRSVSRLEKPWCSAGIARIMAHARAGGHEPER
jgi:hypothetical protein